VKRVSTDTHLHVWDGADIEIEHGERRGRWSFEARFSVSTWDGDEYVGGFSSVRLLFETEESYRRFMEAI